VPRRGGLVLTFFIQFFNKPLCCFCQQRRSMNEQKRNTMKKIFTLLTGILITLVTFAADRPTVTLRSNKNYEIVIDGKSYFSQYGKVMNLSHLRSGRHSVQVFELDRYRFRTTRKLVSASGFRLRNKDIAIVVDPRGNLRISESKFGKDFDRNDRYDNDHDNDWGRGNDRDHDGQGRGNRF
jgi:hypothetical protein